MITGNVFKIQYGEIYIKYITKQIDSGKIFKIQYGEIYIGII